MFIYRIELGFQTGVIISRAPNCINVHLGLQRMYGTAPHRRTRIPGQTRSPPTPHTYKHKHTHFFFQNAPQRQFCSFIPQNHYSKPTLDLPTGAKNALWSLCFNCSSLICCQGLGNKDAPVSYRGKLAPARRWQRKHDFSEEKSYG